MLKSSASSCCLATPSAKLNTSPPRYQPGRTIRTSRCASSYLRALGTLPKVSVHFGHFLTHKVRMPLAVPAGQPMQYVQVIKTEEKGSDVNLATHLLHDAHLGRFDVAVIVSNDSDLLGPVRIVREELGKIVGALNPHQNPSRAMLPHLDFYKPIRKGVLQASQFPNVLTDQHGNFTKPPTW